MRKLFKIHKFAGLSAGFVLIVLGLTGFLLDHKNWSWLYEVKIDNSWLPQSTVEKESKLYETHLRAFEKLYIATKRGIYTQDKEQNSLSLDKVTHDLQFDPLSQTLFAATSDGVYIKRKQNNWSVLALEGSYVNAMRYFEGKLFVSVDKSKLFLIDAKQGETEALNPPKLIIDPRDITLSRFVRDLHYGRGLFDEGWSLLINDAAALYLLLLGLSGYVMFVIIRRQRRGIKSRPHLLKYLTKIHANLFTLVLIIPFFILLVTGIFLDHGKFFQTFLKSTKVPEFLQPPIYESLHEDIWSVDYDGKSFKIGNRFGIFESKDKELWQEVSQGFAYKMMRQGQELYISGMGAPNRKESQEKGFEILPKTPHMFKSVSVTKDVKYYRTYPVVYDDTTLYTLLLTLHDGSFFASWWVWVNDYASLMLLILFVTGTLRYAKKKRWF